MKIDERWSFVYHRNKKNKKKESRWYNDPDVEGGFCGKHDLVSYEEEEEPKLAHKVELEWLIEDTSSSLFFNVTFIVSTMNLEVTIITPVCSVTIGNKPIVVTTLSAPTDKTDCMTPIQSSGFWKVVNTAFVLPPVRENPETYLNRTIFHELALDNLNAGFIRIAPWNNITVNIKFIVLDDFWIIVAELRALSSSNAVQ